MKNLKVKKIRDIFIKLKEEYPILILYIGGNFLNAIFLRLFTTGVFQLRSIFFDLAFILFLASFYFIVKKKRRNLYVWITTFLMVAICITNSLYYNYYSSFISVSLLATSVFVKDVGDAVMQMVVRLCDLTYLWMFGALFIFLKKHKEDHNINKKYFRKSLVIVLISLSIGCAMPPYNSFSRLYKLWNRVMVFNSWGPYVYQIDDLVQSLKPTFNNIFGYDNALKNVNDYYNDNKKELKSNKYTGIYEGKNVIVIHAESLQRFTIGMELNGREVTPNINKLVKSGMYFNNFYAQVGVGTSSDTEFTYATGLLPSNNGTVFVNYYNNKYVTMQKLLNNKGYYVFSMHGNVGDFWNRETMHMNMGYDKFYSKSSFVIDEEYGLGLSDKSFFRQAVPMIKDIKDNIGQPFYGTLITLTNHTPWKEANTYSDFDTGMYIDVDGEVIRKKYLDDTLMGKYLKSVNYMDQAIGKFIDDMDDAGLLENTIIVIYGDHDARLGKHQFDYMYNYNPYTDSIRTLEHSEYIEFNDYDYELSKSVPFIIWSKDMKENMIIDTPMGMIDVMPTLGNMLGVYNKYSLGRDIMATKKEDGIVVFKDGSFITDKIYYNAKKNESYTISNGILSDDYITKRSDYADKIIEVSNDIIVYNLIKELD